MSFRSELAAIAALSLGGCAFSDGDPWAVARLELEVALTPEAGRLDGERIKTADDYRVAIESIELEVEEVALEGAGSAASTFDPANPPDGYSLCHNGHCHAEDGSLVAYEDIGGEATAGSELVHAHGSEVALAVGDVVAAELACEDGCGIVTPGEVARVQVIVAGGRIRGTVFDTRTGEAARLPAEGHTFDVTLAGTTFDAAVGAAVGPGEDFGLRVGALLEVVPEVFDAIPWDTADDTIIGPALGASWANKAALSVETARFD